MKLEDRGTLIPEKKKLPSHPHTSDEETAHISNDLPLKRLSDILITVHWEVSKTF